MYKDMRYARNGVQGGTLGSSGYCLGHPSHAAHMEDVLCHVCGTLVKDARLGPYQVQKLLGIGRSGKAYLARHLRSGQVVVVKLFAPDASRWLWETARREVRGIGALRHPAILPVFSSTLWSPSHQQGDTKPLHEQMLSYTGQEEYLLTLCQYAPLNVIQHLAGSMGGAQRGEQPAQQPMLARVLSIVQRIGAALVAVHSRGIAHGALVPGNILFDEQEQLWVADFGLAKLHPPPTPYLAPELYRVASSGNTRVFWEANTAASDQYMLAVLCQHLLSHTLLANEYQHVMPALQRASHPQPEQRFPTIERLIQELTVLMPHPASARSYAMSNRAAEYSRREHVSSTQEEGKPLTERETFKREPSRQQAQPLSPFEQTHERAVNYQLASSLPARLDDWIKLGDKHFSHQSYDAAVKAYRKALEIDPGISSLWLTLGDAYFAVEGYQEALKAYEYALVLDPGDPTVWSNRGTALDALGRHTEARECYERAEQLQVE